MKRRTRALIGGAIMVLLLEGGVTPVLADSSTSSPVLATYEDAVPGIAPPEALDPGVFVVDDLNDEIPADATAKAVGCAPVTGADNPHRSGTGVAVSAHAWWHQGTCSGTTATVKIALYEYYTDGTWRRKKYEIHGALQPGGGSARRQVARRDCDNTGMVSWRSHVDVDVNWEIDNGDVVVKQSLIPCTVTGPDM